MVVDDIRKLLNRCNGSERLVVWMQSADGHYYHYDVVLAGLQPRKGETRLYFEPSSVAQPPTES